MRAFMIVCLAVVATAGAQYQYPSGSPGGVGETGYNYNPAQGGVWNNGGLETPVNTQTAPTRSSGPAFSDAGYDKHFYFHTAPEEEFEDIDGTEQLGSNLKKNLRVVFIKAPENKGLQNAAIHLAKQASQDKTAVYVLSKQTDLSDLKHQLNQIKATNPQKPEVHFVKYRTPEEAEHAKHAIQAQYDALGGSTHSSNEGVAPVLNYASKTPVQSWEKPSAPKPVQPAQPAPQPDYLPPVNAPAPQVNVLPPSQSYLPVVRF